MPQPHNFHIKGKLAIENFLLFVQLESLYLAIVDDQVRLHHQRSFPELSAQLVKRIYRAIDPLIPELEKAFDTSFPMPSLQNGNIFDAMSFLSNLHTKMRSILIVKMHETLLAVYRWSEQWSNTGDFATQMLSGIQMLDTISRTEKLAQVAVQYAVSSTTPGTYAVQTRTSLNLVLYRTRTQLQASDEFTKMQAIMDSFFRLFENILPELNENNPRKQHRINQKIVREYVKITRDFCVYYRYNIWDYVKPAQEYHWTSRYKSLSAQVAQPNTLLPEKPPSLAFLIELSQQILLNKIQKQPPTILPMPPIISTPSLQRGM